MKKAIVTTWNLGELGSPPSIERGNHCHRRPWCGWCRGSIVPPLRGWFRIKHFLGLLLAWWAPTPAKPGRQRSGGGQKGSFPLRCGPRGVLRHNLRLRIRQAGFALIPVATAFRSPDGGNHRESRPSFTPPNHRGISVSRNASGKSKNPNDILRTNQNDRTCSPICNSFSRNLRVATLLISEELLLFSITSDIFFFFVYDFFVLFDLKKGSL